MKKWPMIGLLVLAATFLGATVLSGPIATAAQTVSATITGPLDGQGNVKVHEQGTANVNVLGNVSTQAGIPATQFSRQVVEGVARVSGPDPAGTNYAITSVSFNNRTDDTGLGALAGQYGLTSDCDQFQGEIQISVGPQVFVAAHQTVTMTFPQPFVIKPESGANSCLVNLGTTFMTVVGYRF
jgi:hypothetical protein